MTIAAAVAAVIHHLITKEFRDIKLRISEAVSGALSPDAFFPTSGRCGRRSALRARCSPAAFLRNPLRVCSCSRANSPKLVTARTCPSARRVKTRVPLHPVVATNRRKFRRYPATTRPTAALNGSAASTPSTNTASAGKSASPTTVASA